MLKAGAAAGAAAITLPALIPARALGRDGAAPASETVRVGIIGCGGRSRDALALAATRRHITSSASAIARSRGPRVVQGRSKGQWPVYDDFRKMIDKEKLDAVMIETTTHARAWIVIQAMQAGVDTYIEKPMCLTIAEGRAMVNAARKFKTVTQVGTQQRSIPLNNFASDLVKNGAHWKDSDRRSRRTSSARNFGPSPRPADVKGAVDPWWDIWTNQAELRPFCEDIHSGWARWIDYDGGGQCFGVTGWGAHSYDQINRALGTDATGPVEVVLEESVANRDSGRFAPRKTVGGQILGDTGDVDTGTQYHAMAKLTGPRAKVTMKFANGTRIEVCISTATAARAWARSSSAKRARSRSIATRWPATRRNSLQDKPGHARRTARHGFPRAELDRVHQEPQALQRRHRDWPSGDDALLPGQHRPPGRPRGRGPPLGPGRRALHQLRRGQQAAHPPAAQGLRIAGHRLSLASKGVSARRSTATNRRLARGVGPRGWPTRPTPIYYICRVLPLVSTAVQGGWLCVPGNSPCAVFPHTVCVEYLRESQRCMPDLPDLPPKPDKTPPKRSGSTFWDAMRRTGWWYIPLVLLILWGWHEMSSSMTKTIDYSQFEDYLAKGEVADCKIDDTDITGHITVKQPPPEGATAKEKAAAKTPPRK